MTTLLIGPADGGVAHVAAELAAHWAGSTLLLVDDRGEVVQAGCGCPPVAPRRSVPPAVAAAGSAWRHRRCVRGASSLHLELGRLSRGPFWFALWATLVGRAVPLVTSTHDVPVVVQHPGAALVATAPGWRDAVAHRVVARVLDPWLLRRLRRRTSATVVLSEPAAGQARRGRWPRVTRAVHGARPRTPGSPAPSRAGYVLLAGFLGPGKGLDVLARAWALVESDLPLVVAGGASPQHAAWVQEQRARLENGTKHPTWRGHVEDAEFDALIRDSAVVVLPYEVSNPVSGVAIRALVEGRAVVATQVPAFVEEIEDGDSGILVPPGDPDALASALSTVMGDPALRDRLGGRAAEVAGARHSWAEHVETLRTLHDQLAVGNRPRGIGTR